MNEYTEKVHAEDHGGIRGGAANVAISQPVNSANA